MIIFDVSAKVNCRKCGVRKTFLDSYAAEDFDAFVSTEFEDNSVDHLKNHGWTRNINGAWFCPEHSPEQVKTAPKQLPKVQPAAMPEFEFNGTVSNTISVGLVRRINGAGCSCGRQKFEGFPFCAICYCDLPEYLREILREAKGSKLEAAYNFAVEQLNKRRRKYGQI